MSTDDLITRARKAIETGQPNLAQLYMRKALEQVDAQRRELNPLKWELRRLGEGFNVLVGAISGAFQIFEHGLRRAIQIDAAKAKQNAELFAGIHSKGDFTLVGPAK